MYCPKCGHQINQPAGGWTQLKTFEQSTALTIPNEVNTPGFASAYRKTPFRKLELVPDVWVPLLQSIISGLLATGVLWVITPALEWAWYTAPIIGIMITGLAWLLLLWAGRAMLWVVEEITGTDIDHDGHVGQPTEKRTVSVEVKEGSSTRLADLPGDEDDLIRFCRYVAAGDSFSERTAQQCGYGITNFRKLRDIFISRRWAYWKNPDTPQQGIELTLVGKSIVKELAQPDQELKIDADEAAPYPLPNTQA